VTRNEDIQRLRASGLSLQELGKRYGLSRERIRQIVGPFKFHKNCANCGVEFVTNNTDTRYCPGCPCPSCGRRLTRTQQCDGRTWCDPWCSPDYKFASEGCTYRSSGVPGIYQRFYLATGIPVEPVRFYCLDMTTKQFTRFESMDEAKAYRESDVWRKERK